ncbi:MAG TPA: hypothetical protein VJ917_08330 [Saprospiraceae bacterium]|nr:hypothetical protein [Saprospiraceae bacterium]
MEEQNTWQERLKDWKAKLEHFNVQLHLGAKEAADAFEEQKKHLKDWIHTAEKQVEKSKVFSEEKTQELKTKLEELRVQAALGRAESRDALVEQQKKISHSMQHLKKDVESTLNKTKEKESELENKLKENVEDFKTKFDLMRLRSHLAQMDAEDAWDKKKKDLSVKLQQMTHKLEKGKEAGAEKWKGFSSEMGEAWNHFVKAIDEAF